ncbi:hypothetical protein A0O34_13740 [Chryseobacterium glaciei]|uniref:Uncharacterized protein n=1 Tax=Chryseobacterium glaciei TaxID=1685010 RepID=A0A172XXA0_9FLAO|nr:hypothetical protein A0O34_13740 [Chryseobacterium glaciei]
MGLISCSNEGNVINTAENMKTSEMQNFKKAFKSLGEIQNRPTEEEKRNPELSERRKALLIPASKDLILSSGVSEKEMMAKTKGNSSSIIIWAYKIYADKSSQINQSLKSQN